MCCEQEGHQEHYHDKSCCGEHEGHHHDGSCGCGEHSRMGPAFWTKEEKVAWLERYLVDLQKEAGAIEERIVALKNEV